MTGGVMKIWTRVGVAIAPIVLWSGAALGQAANPPVQHGATPRVVEGQVVKIDRTQGRVTIRAADGAMHEFKASMETLQELKEGDRIEARLRQP
jgi:hypothetical protein